MAELLPLFAFLGVLALFVVYRLALQGGEPAEVRNGSLIIVERTLRGAAPRPFHGRLDRAYAFGGLHFPVEYKTHTRDVAYATDIAELSLQAELLRQNGYATAPYAFVVNQARGARRPQWIRVDLWDRKAIEQLFVRHRELSRPDAISIPSRGAKCRSCGQASNCTREAQ
ncbi:hypothetical protein KEX41_29535 (plasmid) [Burkholderia thailandensis]|uniref:hypothetical protein n=1 Tax=Burkholderia thailandensis TaxID=57975 RepID=UPI00192D58A1|nr:hypothetical protein [Burkholderia thailandensis]MBS2132326.1 hypothetical protein [Burkholderia thailandensis]QRA15133.1 hypothetical protein JMY07_29960 [Burkholderia thailandensis]